MNDLRDPSILGAQLLRLREDTPNRTLFLSEVYDRQEHFFRRIPRWTGDGLMSNDPEEHHSKTPQHFEHVGTKSASTSAPGFSE